MARRASRSIHPGWIASIAIWGIIVIGGGYWLIKQFLIKNPYRAVQELDVPAFLENSNSLRNNTYTFSGTVWTSLAWSSRWGRLFSVEVILKSGASEMMPVLIPVEFNHVNVQKGQQFQFLVQVDEHGMLRVKSMDKV